MAEGRKNIKVFKRQAILSLSVQAQDWVKYQSQNFTVYTSQSESRVRELLEELEIFRIIAMLQLSLPLEETENQKLAIIMFRNDREFRKMSPFKNAAGFYSQTNDGPRMVMGSARGNLNSAKEILFHEYIHHLIFEHSPGFTYPRWYMEGIAEVFSSASIERDTVVLGKQPMNAGALNYSRPLRMVDLLQNRSGAERSGAEESRFYASS